MRRCASKLALLALGCGARRLRHTVRRPARSRGVDRGQRAGRHPRRLCVRRWPRPDGSLSPAEAARLDGWFRALGLGYGDSIYVDGAYAGAARADVARVAGQYGLLVSAGAPVTAGQRSRRARSAWSSAAPAPTVPDCPNWERAVAAQLTTTASMSNFGCAVNGNLAAMVANPEDLIHGREGSGVGRRR